MTYFEQRNWWPDRESYDEWLARQRRAFPLGFWSLSKHQIVRDGARYLVRRQNDEVGTRLSYFGALRLAQEDGAE